MRMLCMGNEAMGLGAVLAGVRFVSGYPGTPSTEALETIAKRNDGSIHVEWSVNEKAAMEAAAGASYAGARTLVTCKQVGLNVASDPLMSLTVVGVKGGMVVLVADDPGPISSQTEQDTRHYAKFANLPVMDPSSPEEAFEMMQYAFELSEQVGLPVLLRPTTRICHACSTIEANLEERKKLTPEGFQKDSKWVIFPALSYRNHLALEKKQQELSSLFSGLRFNSVTGLRKERKAVAASGVSYSYAGEALDALGLDLPLLKVGTPYPFPEKLALSFLRESGAGTVLCLEELDAVVEDALLSLCGVHHLSTDILGKNTGHVPCAGELSVELCGKILADYAGIENPPVPAPVPVPLPARPPVLCAGCPHRASFAACKEAMKGKKAVFCGDIGCYTLGNAAPLDAVDTCLCMGAGVTIAQGIHTVEPDTTALSFLGDSTFFASGMTGVVNALYNHHPLTLIVLDNSTTAMTGQQPHPGTGINLMKSPAEKIPIARVLEGMGVPWIQELDPLQDFQKAVRAVREAAEFDGVSAVIFKSPCVSLFHSHRSCRVTKDCIQCGKCVRELGCPAISREGMEISIDSSLCNGCGLCASTQICPQGALEVYDNE